MMAAENSGSDNVAAERSSRPLMMPPIGGSNTSAGEASAPVPDVLLSLAKDDRYVSEVFSLLSQAIVPFASIFFVPRRSSDRFGRGILEDDGKQFIERIRPELNLLASILVQSATFVFYTRNLGGGAQVNDVGVQRSIGMEALNLSYRLPHGKNRGTALSQNVSVLRRVKNRMISTLFQMNAWHRLLFLQTVVPYIINRVGRGGWSQDLNGLISTLLETCGLRRPNEIATDRTIRREGPESNNESDDSTFRNDDMLRGSARRRLFLEQRRRMMNSSNDNQRSPLFASEDSGDNEGTNTVQQNEVQRNNASLSETSENTTALAQRWNQLSRLSWEITRRISNAITSTPKTYGSIESQDKYTNIIKWLLRLHLAVFYWSGVYPTITHRIAGAKIHDGAIVANRPSYKPIAALIFLQAASALLQTAASASIEVAHKLQIAYFRWNRRGSTQGQRRISFNETESERAEYLDLVEARVPGIDSSSKESMTFSKKKSKSSKASESHHPCGICLNERIHSAAPSKCGHVFCWNCILHWVVNVREECPLCRASTRPQDVVPLYNYA
ncbi:peroxisome biogenesis factor 10 [Skeletonema marinoi]|uniref:RING-type E3 ubiquitin transferase n=1 Tax=Skeletonema marinoi TaxID=267567 RepID=A0AAD8YHD3_9STRA|nr:peroxisome biogenesis factor 10 [Skeletonema marinoi]